MYDDIGRSSICLSVPFSVWSKKVVLNVAKFKYSTHTFSEPILHVQELRTVKTVRFWFTVYTACCCGFSNS